MKNKFLKPAVALGLVAAMAVSGSLAWVNAQVDEIENKFVVANTKDDSEYLAITLDETFKVDDVETTGNTAKFLPGSTIEKAPVVHLTKLDTTTLTEGAYIFMQLTDSSDVMGLGFEVNGAWTELVKGSGIYYQTYATAVDATAVDATAVDFAVFADDKDTVTITSDKDAYAALADEQTLTVDAWAVQKNNIDSAAEAWVALGFTVPTV